MLILSIISALVSLYLGYKISRSIVHGALLGFAGALAYLGIDSLLTFTSDLFAIPKNSTVETTMEGLQAILAGPSLPGLFVGTVTFSSLYASFDLKVVVTCSLIAGFSTNTMLYAMLGAIHCRIQSTSDYVCVRCGYDLTGNTSGTCPECGETAPKQT